MSIPPAMASDSRTISAAESSVCLISARADGQGIAPAGPGRQDAVAGLDHVAGAAHQQAVPRVHDQEHRFQSPEHPVGPPELGQLGRGAGDVVGIVLQLALEPLQQGKPVGRRSREAHQHLPLQQLAHLHRVGLHHLGAERHLPVAPHGHLAPLAHRENRRRMPVQAGILLQQEAGPIARVLILTRPPFVRISPRLVHKPEIVELARPAARPGPDRQRRASLRMTVVRAVCWG